MKLWITTGWLAFIVWVGNILHPTYSADAQTIYPQPTLGHSQQMWYAKGAAATDSGPCSQVAADILRENGSVVDAGIAAMFCNGVLDQPHMGLGGGVFMTFYESPKGGGPREMVSINGDVRSPEWLTDAGTIHWTKPMSISKMYETMAVPGELAGYHWVWERYGRLPWQRLVQPSIELARQGFHASRILAQVSSETNWKKVDTWPGLEFFKRYHPNGTARGLYEGELIVDERLAETLEMVAEEGATSFYTGRQSELILEDLREYGVQLTKEDLASYRVRVLDTVETPMGQDGQYRVHSPGLPSYGSVNLFVIRVMRAYNMTSAHLSTAEGMALFYHRFAEILKYLSGINQCFGEDVDLLPECEGVEDALISSPHMVAAVMEAIDDDKVSTLEHYSTLLGNNLAEEPEDLGTSHLSIVSRDGSAFSATSTIASVFGCGIKGRRTGIVFNNRLYSFARDLSHKTAKDLRPGSTGYTRRAPTIVLDTSGNTVLSVGSSGGSRIAGGLIKALLLHLEYKLPLQKAVDYPILAEGAMAREFLFIRDPFDQKILDLLKQKDQHFVQFDQYIYPKIYTAVTQGVSLVSCYGRDGELVSLGTPCMEAVSDFRKGGVPAGF